jgi:hypothetical protein
VVFRLWIIDEPLLDLKHGEVGFMLSFFRKRKPPLLSATVLDSTESDDLPEWMLDRVKQLKRAEHGLPLLISQDEVDRIISLSLADQCRHLCIPLHTLKVDKIERPEHDVLNEYRKAGWTGAACEGATLKFLSKACIWKTHTLSVEHRLSITPAMFLHGDLYKKETREKIFDEITQTPLEIIKNRYSDHFAFFKKVLPSTALAKPDDAIQILINIGRENFFELIEMIVDHPMHSHAGWPDLTLVRGNEVKLVEVKVKDKLHNTQIRLISQISRQKIPLQLEVNRLVRG